jgi:glycosyltransferase involved in cell wall biosynthesis
MPLPRVALNGRFSGTLQPTGMQVAAYHLFDAIVRTPRDFELVIFADPAFPGIVDWRNLPGVKLVEIGFSQWSRSRAQLWEQVALPLMLRWERCDLVHHPITTCPRWNLGVRTIVTVHDLGFLHHPEWVKPSFRNWLMKTAVPGIRSAAHVVAISDYVLADIRKSLGLCSERTSRTYNGLPPRPFLAELPTRQNFVILGVNLWQPHKNLLRLLDAFAQLRSDFPNVELHLVGRPQAIYREQPQLAERLKNPGVKILGYLSDEALAKAYRSAGVSAIPSLEEGFGLPLLEAMNAGTSVVTSNVSCLPEIAGGAAILVDPLSVTSLAAGLRQALTESVEMKAERQAKGRSVAAKFSWHAAAKEYILLYRNILGVREASI